MASNGVSVVEVSDNAKTGKVSATYVAQQSCWNGCPLMGHGCYAEHDFTGFTTRRLNSAGVSDTDVLANNEASGIRQLTGKRALRLHVVGDCKTNRAAKTVSSAAAAHTAKHGMPVWSYTHAWRQVARKSWSTVSILASCETPSDVRKASKRGYATAMVVSEHKQATAYVHDGIKLLPCPQQTGKSANCESCKLCWNADRLFAAGLTIAFETHGGGVKKATAALFNIL
jgi:hypothetical protein